MRTAEAVPSALEIIRQHQRSAPVDVHRIARALGLAVHPALELGDGISGKLARDAKRGGASGYAIFVNASEPLVRQRFTVAHEIAHFVLHRDRVGDELVDDAFYRSRLSGRLEAEANRMAADILMPFPLIKELMRSEGLRDIPGLARRLQVSQAALKIRLGIPLVGE
jgi:IrrE N-terminal-like domain